MAGENSTRRHNSRNGSLYALALVGMVVFAIFAGMCIFFRVERIEVVGNSLYTDELIMDIAAIERGQSIFLINASSSSARLQQNLPYAEDVRITSSLPDKVTIEITESYPLAWADINGELWIIDKNARYLERTDAAGIEGKIEILGIEPGEATPGNVMELDTLKLQYLQETLSGILTSGIYDNITWVDMTNTASVKFDYKDYVIRIGRGEKVSDKLTLLMMYFEQNGDDGTGTIDLSTDNTARYIPQD